MVIGGKQHYGSEVSAGHDSRDTKMEVVGTIRGLIRSLLFLLLWSSCEGRDSELSYVTCGSLVKLFNTRHNVRLHSHDVKYGSGKCSESCRCTATAALRRQYCAYSARRAL